MNRLQSTHGFTLFTALVSVLLIVLTVLLAQSMIRTERNITDTIADVQEQQEMQAMADLARADALQVFNYGIRYQIEQYLTNPANPIIVKPGGVTWKEMVRDFAVGNFGGTDDGVQFANRTANHLTNILGAGKGQDFKSFRLDLESDVEQMRTVLQKLFQESVKQDDFFEVIDCPNGEYKKCVGTFYVNLNMSKIGDTDYEKLPQIRVLNRDTGRVIKEPILPRSNFRIYVPLRIFKALAGAKALAHTPNDVPANDSDYVQNTASDYGLLSARVHNEVEEMKLGLCDPRSCAPRVDPYTPVAPKEDGLCPGDPSPNAANLVHLAPGNLGQQGITLVPGASYDVRNPQSMNDALKEIVSQRLEAIADGLAGTYGIGPDNGFEVVEPGPPHVLSSTGVTTAHQVSKNIVSSGGTTQTAVAAPGSGTYPNSPLLSGGSCPDMAEGVGAYLERDAEGNWEPKADFVPVPSCITGAEVPGFCSEATGFDATIVFHETLEKYRVSKNHDNSYTIQLHDGGFTAFTHRYAPAGQVCALPGKPMEVQDCGAVVASDWTCYSIAAPPATGLAIPIPGVALTDKCYSQA